MASGSVSNLGDSLQGLRVREIAFERGVEDGDVPAPVRCKVRNDLHRPSPGDHYETICKSQRPEQSYHVADDSLVLFCIAVFGGCTE